MDKSAAIRTKPLNISFFAIDAMVIGVYCGLFFGLFHDSYSVMFSWWKGGDYSYCVAIPFIAAYAAWGKRRELAEVYPAPSWWGLAPVGGSLLLYFAGELGGEYYSLYISSWLLLVGVCWLHFGLEKIKTAGFSFFLLLTMFPFPVFLYRSISLELQLLSSRMGVALIRLAGVPVHREGNVIDLGVRKLEVVQACNGLRYLLPLMVLGFILAHFLRASFARKALLFLTTIPLAIGINALRIAVTAIAGRELTEGVAHTFSGWTVFMASMTVIFVEMRLLEKIRMPAVERPAPSGSRFSEGEGRAQSGLAAKKLPKPAGSEYSTGRSLGKQARFFAAALLIAAALVIAMGLGTREQVPIRQPLKIFPLKIGQWRGAPVAMDAGVMGELHASDGIVRCYARPGNEPIELFIAYYAAQSKGKSCHSPASCIPGNGWAFEESGTQTLKTPGYGKGATRVSRAFIEKMADKRLVYYWFPQRGRILTNLLQLKLYAFWDTLTEKRSDGAMARLITPVSASEKIEAADKRLQEFTRLILPILDRFVPGGKIN